MQDFQQKNVDCERLVFAPFPLGVGNDFSQHLNFGAKMEVMSIHKYFETLNSPSTKETEMDSWTVTFKTKKNSESKIMMLYFGLGCDGRVAKTYDNIRKMIPFMFKINKLNKIFYAFCHARHWIVELIYGKYTSQLHDIKFFVNKNEIDVSEIGDTILMNIFSRSGGVKHEWSDNLDK